MEAKYLHYFRKYNALPRDVLVQLHRCLGISYQRKTKRQLAKTLAQIAKDSEQGGKNDQSPPIN